MDKSEAEKQRALDSVKKMQDAQRDSQKNNDQSSTDFKT